ncbi:nose resistant to fluoxetine protein 6-like isoform X1 [Anopheles albimanus]|uniref:Nose resistant-to-fluoxetine protein N-terminal domain-containing protein n=2 Tax=Anopheles albimanus TaxID=7167 RepID=A0A182FKZ9_ANOAL|nr:nose resistant to fluoxetine protein 6-like isoform X1 [Anopheles albimanus]
MTLSAQMGSLGSVALLVCLIGSLLPGHVAGQLSVLSEIPYGLLEHLQRVPQLWNATSPGEQECLNQLAVFGASFDAGEQWALSMFDSWGKHPSGILFGNVFAFGNFDQCRRLAHQGALAMVRGQHCTLYVDLSRTGVPAPAPLQYGVCIPDTCEPLLVAQLTNAYFAANQMLVVNGQLLDNFCYRDTDESFPAVTIVAIVLFSIYGAVLLLATIVEIFFIHREQDAPSYVKRFSAYTNLGHVFRIVPRAKGKDGVLDCVNGIRALSMLWIIVNHVHDTAYGIPTFNIPVRQEYAESYFGVLFHRLGGKAVDIFLMLSGMLVSMKMLRELERTWKLNVLELWMHRIVRLTPAYAALILFGIAFVEQVGEGALYKLVADELITACTKSWWAALLYVQNYTHYTSMCFVHTWYLAVDMQLYLLSPLLIYPLWRYGKRFIPAIVLLALLSISCVFATFMVNEYRLNRSAPRGDGLMPRKTYHPTHARMSVWLFGVLFGYLLHRTRGRLYRLRVIPFCAGWLVTVAILVVTGYSLKQLYVGDYTTIAPVADAFYESLHRSLWAFAVMWVIFVCINGQGGIVDRFLGNPLWQPLSRLSYSMYLVHIAIQAITLTQALRFPVEFTVVNLFYTAFGLICISTAVGTVWCIAFEYPFFGLEKYIFRKRDSKSTD